MNLAANQEDPKPLQPESRAGVYKAQLALRVLVVSSASIQLLVDLYHYLLPSSQGIPLWAFWMLPLLFVSFVMGPISVIWLIAEAVAVFKARSGIRPLMLNACLVLIWLFVWSGHV